jgi:hypothetical protein
MFETTAHLGYLADDGDVALVGQLLDFVEPGACVERKRRIGRVGVEIVESVIGVRSRQAAADFVMSRGLAPLLPAPCERSRGSAPKNPRGLSLQWASR